MFDNTGKIIHIDGAQLVLNYRMQPPLALKDSDYEYFEAQVVMRDSDDKHYRIFMIKIVAKFGDYYGFGDNFYTAGTSLEGMIFKANREKFMQIIAHENTNKK